LICNSYRNQNPTPMTNQNFDLTLSQLIAKALFQQVVNKNNSLLKSKKYPAEFMVLVTLDMPVTLFLN